MDDIKKGTYVFLAVLLFFSIHVSSVWAETRTATITVAHLNVREGPGLHYKVIKRVNKGETYAVIEQKNDWIQLRLNAKETGWISLPYASSSASATETAVSAVDYLRVRTGPGTKYAVIGYLKQGQTVAVYEKTKNWAKVHSANLSGWVSADYLSPQTALEKHLIGIVTTNQLNVRAEPSEKGKIIRKLNGGDHVNIVVQQDNWLKIVLENQQTGWVSSTYISLQNRTSPDPANTYIKVLYNRTNIRENPSLDAPVVATANRGETYRVIRKEGSWYYIKPAAQRSGYIAEWVVSTVNKKNGSIKNKTIVLDAGHGGKDSGTIGKNGTLEKTLTLQTAKLLQQKLGQAGANVILTRNDDLFISLPNRVKIAHEHEADIFISIHYDSSHDATANGITVYYYDNKRDHPLAASIYSQLKTIDNMKQRGIRFGDFHVLRENNRPSVLLELGYLSNPTEGQLIVSPYYQEKVTDAIVESLKNDFQ
ncbi:N-acetylmuramoyl-L-alanine amidase [Anoxybacillus vitaminiphilus]|uniref:N-acetylmuramoyl-L-alanine amidase n=1 Tax=Paranoxybacillus vitaminiphilus TaxID=581036 RepID=A0A327YBX8_9BACL|nr:N-acetylmuramoyl-L-alanine amidase [Anoxybacillus vitaminiphilus]RAK17315.1 N-acetylmuramoyl-L-alanine amidase [Anoxybacillus vitaminiphilus]